MSDAHAKHCFVVMPFGRTEPEQVWFKGWYEQVIKIAVEEAGYERSLTRSGRTSRWIRWPLWTSAV